MINIVFGKAIKNMKRHRDIKLATTEASRNYLVSKPNYYTTKCFPKNLLGIGMKKTKILTNKPVYLGLSVLEISKIAMYEFCMIIWNEDMEKSKIMLDGYGQLYSLHKNKRHLRRYCKKYWLLQVEIKQTTA